MIYLIATADRTACKIGTTKNMSKRFSSLQNGNHLSLDLVASREGDCNLERSIHRKLSKYKIRGEWFNLNEEVVSVFHTASPNQSRDLPGPCKSVGLLNDIRTFCAAHSLPPTKLGDMALNDPAFVHKLGKGRRVWPETEDKVRSWMAQYARERAA